MGKSWLADTVPAPRLILDAEGGSQFTPSRPKAVWDPIQYAPPGVEGCAPGQEELPPTTRVMVRDFATMNRVYQWLNAGRHRFRSLAMDSLTEIQKRCLDDISGGHTPERQDWGDLLTAMELLVRQYRDLRSHPTAPLQVITFLALQDPDKKGAKRPHIRGQLAGSLAGFVDTVSHLSTVTDEQGRLRRTLTSAPYPGIEAKDRTDALPPVALIADPKEQLPGYDMASLFGLVEAKHGGATQ